jgi:hypothetical protein
MQLLGQLIRWEIQIFLLALAAVVAFKLLTGEINTSGLLYGRVSSRKRGQDRYFSPEKLQLLVFTVGAGFYYLVLVGNRPDANSLPDLPQGWAAVLGGSNTIYLAGKAVARWFAK